MQESITVQPLWKLSYVLENEVIVVGGGNSAGQAAVFLSQTTNRVHLLIRSGSLAQSMSRYLIRRIEETPNIILRPNTEIIALEGDNHLQSVIWQNNQTGQTETHNINHVFIMTGADPNTRWLDGCIALDTVKVSSKPVVIFRQKILMQQVGHLLGSLTCLKPVYQEFLQLVTFEVAVLSVLHLQWAKDQLRFHLFTKSSKNRKSNIAIIK